MFGQHVFLTTPLLKKSSLDKEDLKNYRPVSNLSYISKLSEKVIVKQLNQHMIDNNLHEPFQSAYRSHHSTETALLRVHNDILQAIDKKNCVMLVLLDLSAAFDTIDHDILLNRFEKTLGLTGSVLSWLKSYFSERYQSVNIKGKSSEKHPLKTGMPQGSVFGPFGFPHYSGPLGAICRRHRIQYHLYADDTQLYISFTPSDCPTATSRLEACISEIRDWMKNNFLKLNDSKTEFLTFGSRHQLAKVPTLSINIGDTTVPAASSARNIGAIFDCHLSMDKQISSISQSCYLHLRNISQIRHYLSPEHTERLVCAFISSKIDHLNCLLYGLPKYKIHRLQLIQNNAARLISRTRRCESITPILISLHWLPVESRIEYKILLLTFKALNGLAPNYLSDLFISYKPPRNLRSGNMNLLKETKPCTVRFGERAFAHCAPKLWNMLPNDMRTCGTLEIFKKRLKTYLFKRTFDKFL